MLVKILIVVVALLLGVLVYAATRPNEFTVQRSGRIKATPDRIYPNIADFHNWAEWSPYEKLDPAMKRTLSGATSGKGAVYEWDGNSKAGKGRMEITDVSVPNKVTVDLKFEKPFKAHNTAVFTLEPVGDSTSVTWAMHGASPFVVKLFGVFVNMDNLVGKDFETGLANLKGIAER